MSIWDILGIESTLDKKVIRRAYTALLKIYHPEDDPEGFMRLRTAYEQALKGAEKGSGQEKQYKIDNPQVEQATFYETVLAENPEIPVNKETRAEYIILNEEAQPENPANKESGFEYIHLNEEWQRSETNESSISDQLLILYSDVFKRREVYEWRKLFLHLSLIEKERLTNEVVRFLTEHGDLPFDVWDYLNDEFALSELPDFQWKELMQYDFGLSFEYLNPEIYCDYTQYVNLRFQAFLLLRDLKFSECIEAGLRAISIYADDPVLYRLLGIAYYQIADYHQSILWLSKLLKKTDADCDGFVYRGYAYYRTGAYEQASADFERAIAIDPEHFDAQKGYILTVHVLKELKQGQVNEMPLNGISKMDLELNRIIHCTDEILKWPEPSMKHTFKTYWELNNTVLPKIITFGIGILACIYAIIRLLITTDFMPEILVLLLPISLFSLYILKLIGDLER
ncbi:tetratricopeptide repeat protein [Paenibacillus sp. NPDC058174]|uniref:tetratricopeptide repeat protein n=1 Tax=Paenibacillus sp. NPDC058174 TaxID=3346366 RepID=UPI0036D9623A